MAVNKNFVVKNGLEVAVDALTVEASSKKVGLGTINPTDTLDVRGGIDATNIEVKDFGINKHLLSFMPCSKFDFSFHTGVTFVVGGNESHVSHAAISNRSSSVPS